jgi:hypothetical protein
MSEAAPFFLKAIHKPQKEIIFLPSFVEKEGSVSIPLGKDALRIEIRQGQRTITLPKGYTLKNTDH